LEEPTVYDGTPGTVKRTDFVFLEVWPSLVPPSPRAYGFVQVVDATNLAPGDVITINGVNLVAALVPGAGQFVIVAGDEPATAYNIAVAITANYTEVYSISTNTEAMLYAVAPGVIGNAITLSVTTAVPGVLLASGPTLANGADRPNKPAASQGHIFRHGNILSPSQTWLPDEIEDVIVASETSQRIQVQYRIRATGANEAVNHKINPDGFSTPVGAPPHSAVYAQGPRSTPAYLVGGARTYPFVPADQSTIWLNSSAVAYGLEDCGLWIAGDGTAQSAQDLGSADGFIYAIPICFAHRHNDAITGAVKGFLPSTNANGAPLYGHAGYVNAELGLIGAGLSDRPDNHFADVISEDNVLDLRHHVIFPGVDLASETKYQIQSLLDGSIRTWSIDTVSKQELGNSTGDVSTHYLNCNEIGRSAVHGGVGSTTRGVFVREFDHIARRFGDQSVIERVVISFYPGDREIAPSFGSGTVNLGKYVEKVPASPDASWYEGDILHLDLTNLDPSTLGSLFQGDDGGGASFVGGPMVSSYLPAGAVITDVLSAYHDDGRYEAAVDQQVEVRLINGLGTLHLELVLDANHREVNGGQPTPPAALDELVGDAGGASGTERRIFLELEITYPIGVGTTDTVYHPVNPDTTQYAGSIGMGPGAVIEEDIAHRPNDFEELLTPRFREGYREVQQEYVVNDTHAHAPVPPATGDPIGSIVPETIVSRDQLNLYFPRRVCYVRAATGVTDIPAAAPMVVDDSLTEYGSSSRKVVLAGNLSGVGQTLCGVTYFAQDPIPNYGILNHNYQLALYFRSNSPQTAGVYEGPLGTGAGGTLPTTLHVEPLFFGDVWSGQIGAGSTDRAFPYGSFSDVLPLNDGGAPPTTKEWYLCATSNISISDFDSSTGLVTLHSFVQADEQNVFEFGGLANPPIADAEFRAFYDFADDTAYRPTILSQPLYGSVRHKVFIPFLARATETIKGLDNGILFRKNELVLIVLSRFATLDDENNVRFIDTGNTTCAALYRTRNLLLLAGGHGRVC
jgi:hypothetical protein